MGLPTQYDELWVQVAPGDLVFFCVKAPVKGTVGSGMVSTIIVDEDLEVVEDLEWVTYILFEQIGSLDFGDYWPEKPFPWKGSRIALRLAFQRLPETLAAELVKEFGD